METVKTQLTDFLNKCEEVKNCKFIMATTKIKDLLKSIVNSAELYELFNTVAANFDYIAAKQKCFKEADGAYGQSKVVLPDTVGDRLAFIFCLLVEFDRNDINFNVFLQKYYPKDGSYYASYHLFCDEVIGSLGMIICDIYARELAEPEERTAIAQGTQEQLPPPAPEISAAFTAPAPEPLPALNPAAASLLNTVCMLIDSEKASVENSELPEEDKDNALSILDSLMLAVRAGDAPLIKSLTGGYNYFAMCNVFVSDSLAVMFEAISGYIAAL